MENKCDKGVAITFIVQKKNSGLSMENKGDKGVAITFILQKKDSGSLYGE